MLIYNNEYETKENKNWTKDKIELQFSYVWRQILKTSVILTPAKNSTD